MISPAALRMGDTVISTSMTCPSLRRRSASLWTTWPARTAAMMSGTSSGNPAGTSMLMFRPTTSSARYPYTRSAPWFQLSTIASSDLPMMTSPEDSTIEARRAAATSASRRGAMSRM